MSGSLLPLAGKHPAVAECEIPLTDDAAANLQWASQWSSLHADINESEKIDVNAPIWQWQIDMHTAEAALIFPDHPAMYALNPEAFATSFPTLGKSVTDFIKDNVDITVPHQQWPHTSRSMNHLVTTSAPYTRSLREELQSYRADLHNGRSLCQRISPALDWRNDSHSQIASLLEEMERVLNMTDDVNSLLDSQEFLRHCSTLDDHLNAIQEPAIQDDLLWLRNIVNAAAKKSAELVERNSVLHNFSPTALSFSTGGATDSKMTHHASTMHDLLIMGMNATAKAGEYQEAGMKLLQAAEKEGGTDAKDLKAQAEILTVSAARIEETLRATAESLKQYRDDQIDENPEMANALQVLAILEEVNRSAKYYESADAMLASSPAIREDLEIVRQNISSLHLIMEGSQVQEMHTWLNGKFLGDKDSSSRNA